MARHPYYNRFLLAVFLLAAFAARPLSAWQLGARPAADWIQTLEREERVSGLKLDEIIEKLQLKPGMVVADIGSGSGVFSRPMSAKVAPSGRVIAVDIESGLLSYISERAAKEGIKNIETHLGVPEDAKLSGPIVDVALIHDALHHIETREVYLRNLVKYIKPGGKIAIVDLDKNDPQGAHRDRPELQVDRADALKWLAAGGFHPSEDYSEMFPGKKWFLIFTKK